MVPRAGHALSEAGITAELVRTMRGIQRQATALGF
jgi:proline iminopeptidase